MIEPSGQGRACQTCRYYVGLSKEVQAFTPIKGGECHRMPPTQIGWSVWPLVRVLDWCGEYVTGRKK